MDEKLMAVVGAAAAVTVAGRGLRPIGKLMMRGVVAATEATGAGKRGVESLYNEVKAEREQGAMPGAAGADAETSTPPAAASTGTR